MLRLFTKPHDNVELEIDTYKLLCEEAKRIQYLRTELAKNTGLFESLDKSIENMMREGATDGVVSCANLAVAIADDIKLFEAVLAGNVPQNLSEFAQEPSKCYKEFTKTVDAWAHRDYERSHRPTPRAEEYLAKKEAEIKFRGDG